MTKKSSFPLLIWSGLFAEKHRKRMGMAVWLFMLFIDMVTKEEDGVGMVWGGKPINFKDVNDRFDISRRTYQNYLTILQDHHYIETKRTQHGLIVMINKSKKRRRINKLVEQEIAQVDDSDVQNAAPTSAESCTLDVQDVAFTSAESCTTLLYSGHNKDYTKDNKKTLVLNSKFKKTIWKELYEIFNLEDSAYSHYEKLIETMVEKHSPYKAISAVAIFKAMVEDHPPSGRVKNINTLLRFDIDNYVARVKDSIPYVALTCTSCKKTAKVKAATIGNRYKELGDSCSQPGCKGKVIITTGIIESWLNGGFKSNQIKPLMNKYIEEKYE